MKSQAIGRYGYAIPAMTRDFGDEVGSAIDAGRERFTRHSSNVDDTTEIGLCRKLWTTPQTWIITKSTWAEDVQENRDEWNPMDDGSR